MRPSGEYLYRVTIEAPSDEQSASGAIQPWPGTEVGRRWARIVPQGAREFERMSVTHAEMTALIELRGRCAVDTTMRAHHRSRIFEILGAYGSDGRAPEDADSVILVCKEVR